MTLKNNLCEFRMKLKFRKQKEFADFLGIPYSTYSKIELNKAQPTIKQLFQIASKLGVGIEQIIFDSESESDLEVATIIEQPRVQNIKRKSKKKISLPTQK